MHKTKLSKEHRTTPVEIPKKLYDEAKKLDIDIEEATRLFLERQKRKSF